MAWVVHLCPANDMLDVSIEQYSIYGYLGSTPKSMLPRYAYPKLVTSVKFDFLNLCGHDSQSFNIHGLYQDASSIDPKSLPSNWQDRRLFGQPQDFTGRGVVDVLVHVQWRLSRWITEEHPDQPQIKNAKK